MSLILDTSVFITIERRDLSIAVLPAIIGAHEQVAMSSMTLSELLMGTFRAESSQRRARRQGFVDALLDHFPVLSFDYISALTHARIKAQLVAEGRIIGPNDLIIAATAVAHGYEIMTDNVREFQRVPDLVVRQPEW